MAKKKANPIQKPTFTPKVWKEADLIDTFQLNRLKTLTPLMQEWLTVTEPKFNMVEQHNFDTAFQKKIY